MNDETGIDLAFYIPPLMARWFVHAGISRITGPEGMQGVSDQASSIAYASSIWTNLSKRTLRYHGRRLVECMYIITSLRIPFRHL